MIDDKTNKDKVQYEVQVPDITAFAASFKENRLRIDPYIMQCKRNMDTRFCRWSGQSNDQRKHATEIGQSALPWEGASDFRYFVIDAAIKALVSGAKAAIKRMRITANPTSSGYFDIRKANHAAMFMRWLMSQVPNLTRQVEILANHLASTGVCVSYQYWQHEEQKLRRMIELGDLPPEEQQLVLTPEQEEVAFQVAKQYLTVKYTEDDVDDDNDGLLMTDDEIRAMIAELREKGKSVVYYSGVTRNNGAIVALSPFERILFPVYTINVQDAGFVDMIMYYNAQELRQKVEEDGWNKDFVDRLIDTCMGRDNMYMASSGVRMDGTIPILDKIRDVVQVVHRFSKVTDKKGCPVIYETIFHPNITQEMAAGDNYGKHAIREDALGEYPFVVTKWEDYSERLYEVRSIVELLSGTQFNLKAFTDAAIDRESITKLPPQKKRMTSGMDADGGYAGPMQTIFVREQDDVQWMPPPPYDVSTTDIRQELKVHMDMLTGMPNEQVNPTISQVRTQDFFDKIAEHLAGACKQIYKLSKIYGSDAVWFRVGGSQEMVQYRHEIGDDYDFTTSLDASNNDLEQIKLKVAALGELRQMDQSGIMPSDKFIKLAANVIDPVMADELIGSPQEAQERSVANEDVAIAKVCSGIMLDLTQDEQRNQVQAQRFFQWFQTPTGQAAANNPLTGEAVQARATQWQFAMQQAQNAQIGRLGTTPTNNGSNQSNIGAGAK